MLCRDVDETIGWIKEKEQLMASDDFGRDLASVQALLRKHEGLERDLAALEDKVTHRYTHRRTYLTIFNVKGFLRITSKCASPVSDRVSVI